MRRSRVQGQSHEVRLTERFEQDSQWPGVVLPVFTRIVDGFWPVDRGKTVLGLVVQGEGQPDLGQVLLAARKPGLFSAAGHRHEHEQHKDRGQAQHHDHIDHGESGEARVGPNKAWPRQQTGDTLRALRPRRREHPQFLTTTSASPEPTLPAASVARTMRR